MNTVLRILLLAAASALLLVFRKTISHHLSRIRLPELLKFLLISVLLIIFEENINCIGSYCSTITIPPTVPVLFAEVLAVYVCCAYFKPKSIFTPVILYALAGLVWELAVGGLHSVLLPLPLYMFFLLWVPFSYAFYLYTPLSVLKQFRPER